MYVSACCFFVYSVDSCVYVWRVFVFVFACIYIFVSVVVSGLHISPVQSMYRQCRREMLMMLPERQSDRSTIQGRSRSCTDGCMWSGRVRSPNSMATLMSPGESK